MRHKVTLPFFVNALIIAAGALAVGKNVAVDYVAPDPTISTVVAPGSTRTVESVKVVTRKVHGRIVHIRDQVYVTVPQVIVHVDHRTIRIPAHRLPIRAGSAVVAKPVVTVYVPVPTTSYVPTVVTSTVTSVSTETITIPTTITLPLTWTDDPSP